MPCVWVPEDRREYQIPWLSLYFIRSQRFLWMIVVESRVKTSLGLIIHTHTVILSRQRRAHVAFLGEHLYSKHQALGSISSTA